MTQRNSVGQDRAQQEHAQQDHVQQSRIKQARDEQDRVQQNRVQRSRVDLFDRWAADYDRSVQEDGEFPFAGYEDVLTAVVECASVRPGMRVLDVGIGTGNLAERFVRAGCDVWGVDFSANMLEKVRQRLPQVRLVQADLARGFPEELHAGFDRIVSAYVLHEFNLDVKVELLREMVQDGLAANGLVVIGDVGFRTVQERQQAYLRWKELWDEQEYYWAADEAVDALSRIGLQAEYKQVSVCAGVMVIRRR